MGPGSGDQVLDESGGLKKVKVGMRFQLFLKASLDFIWEALVIIARHPLLWLAVVCFFLWVLAQTPITEPETCPTCQQQVKGADHARI